MIQTRQLVAIMFTDIVGYTSLMGNDEDAALKVLEQNRQLHKSIIEEYNGKWLKEMGDGVLLSFDAASDAVFCAKKIQETCQKENEISLRIGIHLGEVVFTEEDVFGDGVNIASRIESLAPAGCIYISESVLRNVENKKEIITEFVGEKALKNVKHPVRIYQVKIDGQLNSENSTIPNHIHRQDPGRSIAVLPFVNMSNESDQDYFCDGLTEELLNVLSQLDKFKVASRTSSFFFKGKNSDISEIGRTLNVETVLEGSVRKSQNRIRITVQLINVHDGFHLWSEKYDRELEDIFDVQDEIALAILDALKLKLLGNEKAAVLKRYTENPEAYQHYLRGREKFHKFTKAGYLDGIEYYKLAIELDPAYSKAHAGVASCYLNLWHFDLLPADQSLPHMITATNKSMECDNQIAESHLAMARLKLWYEFDLKEAEKEFEKVMQYNPNISDAVAHYGFVKSFSGNKIEGLKLVEKALELDPFSPMANMNYASILWQSQEFEIFLKQGNKMVDLFPFFWAGYFWLGFYYWAQGKHNDAIQAFEKSLKLENNILLLALLGCLYGIKGGKKEADAMLNGMNEITKGKPMANFCYAILYAGLNEMDKAFIYFEKASVERTGLLIFLDIFRTQELIPAFKNNSRLQEYIETVGIPQFGHIDATA